MRSQAADDGAARGRAQRAPARAAHLRSPLIAAAALVACTSADIGTTPFAHESPPTGVDGLQYLRHDSYHGGTATDVADDVAYNFTQAIVAGGTASSDFVTTDGSTLDTTTPSGCSACPFDATIMGVADDGTVLWSRIIGGPGYDRAVTLDLGGTFVAGSTGGGLTTTSGAGDRTFAGGATPERGDEDGFVCRLSAQSGAFVWCSYVGGSGPGGVTSIAVRGDVYVAFAVGAGENLHLDPDYQAAFAAGQRGTPQGADIVVLQLASSDGHFVAATYAGGSGDERGPASVATDGGYVHLVAGTASTDVPTPNGFRTTPSPGNNLFFTTYAPGLSAILYGTYIGGSGDEEVNGNALAGWSDVETVAAVGITTTSRDLPFRNGIHGSPVPSNSSSCGAGDVWYGTIAPTRMGDASLLTASYLGGTEGERLGGISALSTSLGRVLALTGETSSWTTFPTSNGRAWQGPVCTFAPGATEAFAAYVNVTQLMYSGTFFGGSAIDRSNAIMNGVAVGETRSSDFDTHPGGDATLGGTSDGYLVAFMASPPSSGGDGGPRDASTDGSDFPNGDYGQLPEDGGPSIGCCGTAPGPVAPGTLALGGLVMLLVRRRRGR